MKPSEHAEQMLADPLFRNWLGEGKDLTFGEADAVLKEKLLISSKSALDLDGTHERWDNMLASYDCRGYGHISS